MTVHWLRGDNPARLGLAVSRKVDTRAVGRNRIKRVLRNATRHLLTQMSSGDFVVVARAAAREASNEQILLRRAGALPPMGPEVTMTSPGSVNPFPLNGPESASGRVEPAC
jgi:ribonuclease P protein component